MSFPQEGNNVVYIRIMSLMDSQHVNNEEVLKKMGAKNKLIFSKI